MLEGIDVILVYIVVDWVVVEVEGYLLYSFLGEFFFVCGFYLMMYVN